MSDQPDRDVVKWYTRARKFPQLIGRTPDGARIWGGPYTFTQAVGAGLVLFVGLNTMGLWAHYGLLGNAVVLLGGGGVVVMFLGRIPVGSRNPLSVAAGATRAVTAPRSGRVAGHAVRLRRPHHLRHRVSVLRPPDDSPQPTWSAVPAPAVRDSPSPSSDAPKPTPSHRPTGRGHRLPPLTGVQSLLAQAAPSREAR